MAESQYNWREMPEIMLKRKEKLEELIAKKSRLIQQAPKGSLRILKRKGYNQYFIRTDPKDTNGVYIPKAKMALARQLAQKDYDEKIVKAAKAEQAVLDGYMKKLKKDALTNVYGTLDPAKRELVTPILMDDDEFIRAWRTEEYEPMLFDEGNAGFYTEKGIRLRSKSELIIANLLEQSGIPYRYEYPMNLKGIGGVRPDFLCLNIRTRKEYVWEHFGMMDNISYARKAVSKIHCYEQNGYHAGKNMIMTFETSSSAMNPQIAKTIISEYLL
ncbi:MAG: hypothetical protein K6F75_09735 [Butyrivibrio sp.]|nr:hypothetical protein [Butyrivibrio sp.]